MPPCLVCVCVAGVRVVVPGVACVGTWGALGPVCVRVWAMLRAVQRGRGVGGGRGGSAVVPGRGRQHDRQPQRAALAGPELDPQQHARAQPAPRLEAGQVSCHACFACIVAHVAALPVPRRRQAGPHTPPHVCRACVTHVGHRKPLTTMCARGTHACRKRVPGVGFGRCTASRGLVKHPKQIAQERAKQGQRRRQQQRERRGGNTSHRRSPTSAARGAGEHGHGLSPSPSPSRGQHHGSVAPHDNDYRDNSEALGVGGTSPHSPHAATSLSSPASLGSLKSSPQNQRRRRAKGGRGSPTHTRGVRARASGAGSPHARATARNMFRGEKSGGGGGRARPMISTAARSSPLMWEETAHHTHLTPSSLSRMSPGKARGTRAHRSRTRTSPTALYLL